MRNVSDSSCRVAQRRSDLVVWLALAALVIGPNLLRSTSVMAQEPPVVAAPETDASEANGRATLSDASPAAPFQARSTLAYVAEACGWFWGPAFLLCSFILVALIMMNLLQVRRAVLLPADFVEEFEQKLNAKDFQGAYEYARSDESFVARVLAAGMGRLSRGYEEAVEGMQEAGEDENMALEHRLSYVAMIATIAPMMGLMGTVTGMISCFGVIGQSREYPEPSQLANGISTALVTTLIGLLLAVPAMVFYGILRNRIQRLVLEIGMVSEGLMGRFAAVGKPKS